MIECRGGRTRTPTINNFIGPHFVMTSPLSRVIFHRQPVRFQSSVFPRLLRIKTLFFEGDVFGELELAWGGSERRTAEIGCATKTRTSPPARDATPELKPCQKIDSPRRAL